jgi:hypothetical protein
MKKLAFFILIIIIFTEVKDHPAIAPYVDNVIGMITSNAMDTMEVTNFNLLLPELNALNDKLLPHEIKYAVDHIKTQDDANQLWNNICRDVNLAHSVLTTYAKHEICAVIRPYTRDH